MPAPSRMLTNTMTVVMPASTQEYGARHHLGLSPAGSTTSLQRQDPHLFGFFYMSGKCKAGSFAVTSTLRDMLLLKETWKSKVRTLKLLGSSPPQLFRASRHACLSLLWVRLFLGSLDLESQWKLKLCPISACISTYIQVVQHTAHIAAHSRLAFPES